MGIDDSIRTLPIDPKNKRPTPMACCPKDGEPLVLTLEFKGAEFICMGCKQLYGFLAPIGKPNTPELQARYAELKAQYAAERKERELNRKL